MARLRAVRHPIKSDVAAITAAASSLVPDEASRHRFPLLNVTPLFVDNHFAILLFKQHVLGPRQEVENHLRGTAQPHTKWRLHEWAVNEYRVLYPAVVRRSAGFSGIQ
jgi:hypothetical protein